MANKLVFLLMVFISLSFARATESQDNIMSKFNIEQFNKNKTSYYWFRTLEDGTQIKQTAYPNEGYNEDTIAPNSPYIYRKSFNNQGELTGTIQWFYSFLTGTQIVYDGKGNIVGKKNLDKDFKFSVEDVAKKMRTDFNVDIMKSSNIRSLSRAIDLTENKSIPVYEIYVIDQTQPTQCIAYLIHGDTGELLHSMVTDMDGSPNILKVYKTTQTQ